MDGAGRIVIPAALRRELALGNGSELEIEVDGGAIVLRPVGGARPERRAGRLVVGGSLAGPVPDHRDLREESTERLLAAAP
jgi:AbrB family looped-hinge helix DNA binding protein